jgi:hypothetical protein
MGWPLERLAEELPRLDRMARFKYDEYQQFGPGQKFLEALCLWLVQFKTAEEREAAYDFVRRRLVFISAEDMRHLVEISFPDVVRPMLIAGAASRVGVSPHRLSQVIASPVYRSTVRSTLFLGLSDGSRMDVFRRSANLDNEQVWQAYEMSAGKSAGMLGDLRGALNSDTACFERIVLIDDFSASGISYARNGPDGWKGKAIKALMQFGPDGEAKDLVDYRKIEMHIVLYVATRGAVENIQRELKAYAQEHSIPPPTVTAVYELPPDLALNDTDDSAFLQIADDNRYYRTRPLDSHEAKGKTTTVKRGFAACALPVVLAHNCPNNSVYLLWADPLENDSARGLFLHPYFDDIPDVAFIRVTIETTPVSVKAGLAFDDNAGIVDLVVRHKEAG